MPSSSELPSVFRFACSCEPADIDNCSCPNEVEWEPSKDRLKAYQSEISPEMMENYTQEYERKRETLQHISFTEYATFKAENKAYVLEGQLQNIRAEFFGFRMIQHSDYLVKFYTGLPNAAQFHYVSRMLHSSIIESYSQWEPDEKHGFLNHTLITLMKLRLNMPDEELAERFGIEPYMVNMTLRTWLPELYLSLYKSCEIHSRPRVEELEYKYTKVLGIVEVCFETSEYTRRHRGNKHEARKAVISVQNGGFIDFASSVVSLNRPDADTIKRSHFEIACFNSDMVAVYPDHYPTVAAMGIDCHPVQFLADLTLTEAVFHLRQFRILMAIPEEYRSFHEFIFPVCAALSNFHLVEGDPHIPNDELPHPLAYEQ